jgi:cytochrome c peroxidase
MLRFVDSAGAFQIMQPDYSLHWSFFLVFDLQRRLHQMNLLLLLCLLACATYAFAEKGEHRADAKLGEYIFFEQKLSSTGDVSCATCHRPDRFFSDGLPVSVGAEKRLGTRNAPSLLNLRHHSTFFWDGREASLEKLVLQPFTNVREHGLRGMGEVLDRLKESKQLELLLTPEEKQKLSEEKIAKALVAFLTSLSSKASRFDEYLMGNQDAMSLSAQRGLALFKGKAKCSDCHLLDPEASLTDNLFHRLHGRNADRGLGDLLGNIFTSESQEIARMISADAKVASLGRFLSTKVAKDLGAFRTPSLKNVALTGPYFHDGSVASLSEAIDIELYYRGLGHGRPLVLTVEEKQELMEFLKALTSK